MMTMGFKALGLIIIPFIMHAPVTLLTNYLSIGS